MMLRLGLLSALVVGLVLGQAYQPDYRTKFSADKDFLAKQKKIYHVLAHYFQPELKPELQKEGHEYNVEAHADSYTNKHAVKDFLHRAEHGFLPHDSVFSVYYPHTLDQTLAVFRLMYYAKDFDAFHKTALYLRNVLNPGMFLYAYNLAVLHRPDTKYMRLPALYELAPHYFYNVELLEKAHHVKKYGKLLPKHSAGYDTYVIPYNYSNYYLSDEYDYEQRLNYFTEDIGLNNYYFYFRANTPFFVGGEELHGGQAKSYRGEEYLYGHQMLFNRYFLERLSQGLPHVEDYDYHGRFYAGYWPSMSYPNGMHFPSRPADSHLPKSKLHWIQDAAEYESRIGQAVDSGIAFTKEGKTTKLYGAANPDDGLNILGNMIEGNADSVNERYYGRLDWLQRKILGFNLAPMSPEKLHPSSLEHETTSLRDPAFWRIYKRLLHYYQRYKHNQGPYKPEEISYPELKIERVETDRLETYFDHFDSSIGHGLYVDHVAEAEAYVIQARQHRLNHKHFNVNLEVHAAKPTKAAIRIFLGPKYNVHMKELDFKDHHDEFYEMDNFIYDLAAGPNKIVRNCHDFFFVSEDPEPYEVFLQRIGMAADATSGGEELKLEKRVHGFPARLLLPKGRPEGMPFQLFVHVAPVLAEPVHYTSRVFGDSLMDNRPLGYPLDRPISEPDFHGPNFYFKDVLIYHQQEHDKTVHY